MKLKTAFEERPAMTTSTIIVGFVALVFALLVLLSSCSVVRREGSTSPCYTTKHYVGYGFGGFGKGRMKH
jgi:hypothetical protein